jgi:hypothetical protein
MRSRICLPLLASLAALAFAEVAQARMKTTFPVFGQPCECAWFVHECLPTCHPQPRLECAPTQ